MRRFILGALLSLVAVGSAAEDLLEYAKRTADRLPSEVRDASVRVTVRLQLQPISISPPGIKFDHGLISIPYERDNGLITRVVLGERCSNTGTYIANNAFNAKVRVTKQWCESVILRGPDELMPLGLTYHDVFGLKLRGSPDDYRKVLGARGVDIEIDVQLEAPDDGDFITIKERSGNAPSFNYPYEISGYRYTVYGRLLEIRFYVPGAKRPFAKQDPHPASDNFTEDP